MKSAILTLFLVSVSYIAFSQSAPSDGTYQFKIFDKEYGKTTAECRVVIKGRYVSATVTKSLYGNIYSRGQVAYEGLLKKKESSWYIVENNSASMDDEDFEYSTPRIDFNRKYIIHY